jgi:hypothetical protein
MDGDVTSTTFTVTTFTATEASWDLDAMINQIRRALHAEVDPLTIRSTLVDILATFEDAPVKTFVPIFACRAAVEVLKK